MTDEPVQMDNRAMKHSVAGQLPPIGCHEYITGHGTVHYCEAQGLMTSAVHAHGDHQPPTAIAVMVQLDAAPGFRGRGLIFQMDAAAARDVAASLLKLAADLDPEVAN